MGQVAEIIVSMSNRIFRGDAAVQQQVTTLTPAVANSATYLVAINGKKPPVYTADSSATAQEIVEGVQAILDASEIAEFLEATWTEDNAKIIGTGPTTGAPFTVVDGGGTAAFTPSTTTDAKSPNHWIAENFSGATLPANSDDVFIGGTSVGVLYGLSQSAVTLGLLDIRADFTGEIGLPEINASGAYYEYRDTHLKISASVLKIGDGVGQGSGRIKIDLGTNACDATIFSTGSPADQDEAPVHLVGAHASNQLQVISGQVDVAMLPGYTAEWPTIFASNGTVRCGAGVTLTTVESAGNSQIETRSTMTTLRLRDNGRVVHYGGNITTADLNGGVLVIRANAAMTIATLNGYAGRSLDLSQADGAVTVTDMNVYGYAGSPFVIIDPNNKLVMTNPASCPNGVEGLVIQSGSNRKLRIST